MRIYNLPQSERFQSDFLNDIDNATEIVIVSPYLSIEVIKYIRERSHHLSKNKFTIVYDVDHNLKLNIEDDKQIPDDLLINSITWKLHRGLHSKLYYLKLKRGYSLYHGSANFTNRGLGLGNLTKGSRNAEVMSRVDDIDITFSEVQTLIAPYLDNEIVEPIFDNKEECFFILEEDSSKRKEYDYILKRMGLDTSYFNASAKDSIQDLDGYFQGYFKSRNHYSLKIHTTSIMESKNERAEFTLPYKELKWFLGGFRKYNCNTSSRKLLLVWKVDEDYKGRLVVFTIYPYQLFKLLSKNNHRRRVLDINSGSSRTIWFEKSFETAEINWRNNPISLPRSQVRVIESSLMQNLQ